MASYPWIMDLSIQKIQQINLTEKYVECLELNY
jgi:hypothetical protein